MMLLSGKNIPAKKLNGITGVGPSTLYYGKGSVRFGPTTPVSIRNQFLITGGTNLSKYNTVVELGEEKKSVNLVINEIPGLIKKFLCKLGVVSLESNVKSFYYYPQNPINTLKEIKDFIGSDSINKCMKNADLMKKAQNLIWKMLSHF